MEKTILVQPKKVISPRLFKDKKAWEKLEVLAGKINRAWKSKKTALELIKQERR